MDSEISQLSQKLKKTELKMRQITMTKMKDLQRQLKAKEIEINLLRGKMNESTVNSKSPGFGAGGRA